MRNMAVVGDFVNLTSKSDFAEVEAVNHGACTVYETLAEALLNVPSEQVLADVCDVAHVFGVSEFDDELADDALEQCYYNRMFVASHPCYVALSESMVVSAGIVDGRVEYGSPAQGRRAQVVSCYKKVGFSHKSLEGFDLSIQSLKADSLASELAFMAFLHHGAGEGAAHGDIAKMKTYHRLALHFLEQHLSAWAQKAAHLAAASGEDFYSRLCAFISQGVEADQEQLKIPQHSLL